MVYEGVWKLVSICGLDFETMEKVWKSNEELKEAPEDFYLKSFADSIFIFNAEPTVTIFCNIEGDVSSASEEEIKQAVDSGRFGFYNGTLMMRQDLGVKEENGTVLIDSGEHGEVLGQAIDPFRPVEVCGNTLIINKTYQIVRENETPSVVMSTASKPKREISDEMKAAAGTYIGLYTKFVGDPEDAKNTTEAFKLVLNDDGTGMQYRNNLEIKIPEWSLENGAISLTEKFLGTIDYTGTLSGNRLSLFNNDPANPLTCEYVYEFQK